MGVGANGRKPPRVKEVIRVEAERLRDDEHEKEDLFNTNCLLFTGKLIVILFVSYQLLQIFGKHWIKEIREKFSIDSSSKMSILPPKEKMVCL